MYRLTNGQIEIQMDGQTDGQIGGQTDGQTERKIGFLLTDPSDLSYTTQTLASTLNPIKVTRPCWCFQHNYEKNYLLAKTILSGDDLESML